MHLRFGASLSGFVPGLFGRKDDVDGRKSYADLKTVFDSPELKPLLNTPEDDVIVIVHKELGREGKIRLETQTKKLYCRPDGIKGINIAPAEISNQSAKIIKRLQSNIDHMAQVGKVIGSLKKFQDTYSVRGWILEELIQGKNTRDRLSAESLDALHRLSGILADPEVQQAFSQQKDYKWYQANFQFKDRDFETFLEEKGTDLNTLLETDMEKYRELNQEFDPRPLADFSLDFRFKNMGFHFAPDAEMYVPGSDSAKHQSIRISVADLKNDPEKVKQTILKAQTYWNQKITEYVG